VSEPAGAVRLRGVTVSGPAGALEALIQERDDRRHALAAVVCHPHPLYGGTMHNKVVHRVASVLHELGAAVLRFNFRGAGESEGAHDRGAGEVEDARAALSFLAERYPSAHLWVAGFSFGSWIAARLAASEPKVERLVLIAPPIKTSSFEVLRTWAKPKLVVQGTMDDVCAPSLLEGEFPTWADPKELKWVADASHFFDRQLGGLAEALREELKGPAEAATSRIT